MRLKINRVGILTSLVLAGLFGCKDDAGSEIEILNLDRVLSVSELTARVRNQTSVEVGFNLRENALKYVLEFSQDSLEFGSIIRTSEVMAEDVPVLLKDFAGDTRFSVRVKAIGEDGTGESNWVSATFKTSPENLFQTVSGENIGGTTVVLNWVAGSNVTHILLNPGNITRSISEDEKALGEAQIENLEGRTEYTAILYNNEINRGSTQFTTLAEATVFPSDDLSTKITEAEDGAELVLAPGEYTLGSYAVTKSIKIVGQKSNDMPLIHGQITCETTVGFIEINTVKFSGLQSGNGQFFNANTGCSIDKLSIVNSDISGYTNNFIYNNKSGVFGEILVSGNLVHDIPGGGGDGIDFRSGTIGKLTVENNTFYNAFRSFLRMQVSCEASFKNNTFYKVSTLDNSNNSGLFRLSGGGSLEVKSCLFVETGVENPTNITSGNWCRQASYMVETPSYSKNYYFNAKNLWAGLYTDPTECDAEEADPGFVDTSLADFTVTNQNIIDEIVGDPRWLGN